MVQTSKILYTHQDLGMAVMGPAVVLVLGQVLVWEASNLVGY